MLSEITVAVGETLWTMEDVQWRRYLAASLNSFVAQQVRSLPAMQETWVWSLGWEDPLEKEMATHSSILALKIPWIEESGGLQFMGLQRVGQD